MAKILQFAQLCFPNLLTNIPILSVKAFLLKSIRFILFLFHSQNIRV